LATLNEPRPSERVFDSKTGRSRRTRSRLVQTRSPWFGNRLIERKRAHLEALQYNVAMSFKHLDVENALRRVADRKIEEAMREGKFDNLPGAGKPLDLDPIPTDERARLLWWALKLLKQNDVVPEEVTWRKQIDDLKQKLAAAGSEGQITALVMQINRLVWQLNTLGTNAIASPIAPVSLDSEIIRFRMAGPTPTQGPHVHPPPAMPSRSRPLPAARAASGVRHCTNAICKSRNPGTARFCRRCGSEMR